MDACADVSEEGPRPISVKTREFRSLERREVPLEMPFFDDYADKGDAAEAYVDPSSDDSDQLVADDVVIGGAVQGDVPADVTALEHSRMAFVADPG